MQFMEGILRSVRADAGSDCIYSVTMNIIAIVILVPVIAHKFVEAP